LVLEASSQTMPTCVLRPSVLFGKGDTQLVPPIHACLAKQETPWVVGDGTNLWDVTYVENVADAHVLAAENLMSSKTAAGEVFFIQNNEPIPFRDFTLEVWKNFGHVCGKPLLLLRSLPFQFVYGAYLVPLRPYELLGTHRRDLHDVNVRGDQQLMLTTSGTAIRVPYPQEYRLVDGLIGRMENFLHGYANHT
jgi:nucleoside-diphosphate-sugar epimerase